MNLPTRLFAPPPPLTALEIAPGRVTGLRLGGGSPPTVAAHATERLADGAVVPSLTAPNLIDQAGVADAVRSVLRQIGGGRRVALVIPDDAARVSVVRFETVPARQSELETMLRWQVRKSVPFRTEDAQLTWSAGLAVPGGGREFVVVIARRDVIAQYEAACEAAGAYAGLVDLATLNLVNVVLAGAADQTGDWLLVHVTPLSTSLAIVRDAALAFYRHRGVDEEEALGDLVHQTAMYYEDRLSGRGFGRVLLAGTDAGDGPEAGDAVRRQLEQRLGVRVERVDARSAVAFADRIDPGPTLRDRLAPLAGILAREPLA